MVGFQYETCYLKQTLFFPLCSQLEIFKLQEEEKPNEITFKIFCGLLRIFDTYSF